MLENVLRSWSRGSAAHNENVPESQAAAQGAVSAANVRALAVSVDTSPAVLVSIYDYAHRYRDKGRRCA